MIDPQQRIFLESAWEAIGAGEDTTLKRYKGSDWGVCEA